jgi:hypothetical protein
MTGLGSTATTNTPGTVTEATTSTFATDGMVLSGVDAERRGLAKVLEDRKT